MSESPEPKPAQPQIKELSGKIGKYEIVKPLGKGAMGMVYLAHDSLLERDVALKVMVAGIADDPELKMRFEREAKAVAKMTHPNVVMVFDLGYHTDGSPYIAMELLKGSDLQKAMRTPPPMPLERKVAIIVQTLAGLAHAHQAGIVHRDIKPANIFINLDGSVKIMDFGVARLTTASMTGTGSIVGTADYMSPEQVKGAKVDGRSDLFSVGCMLYELLAGRRPFRAENLMAIFYKITHEEPDYNAIPAGEEYDALMAIIRKALAKNLEDRYRTAYDFAMDLREFLKGHASSASAAEHALEGLVDIEPPPTGGVPAPMTEPGAAGPTLIDEAEVIGTVDLGPTAGRGQSPTAGRSQAPTIRGEAGPTVVTGGTRVGGVAPTVAVPGARTARGAVAPTVVRPSPAPPAALPRPVPAPAPSGSPWLYVVLGGMGVMLLGAGGYIYLTRGKPEPSPSPVALLTPTPPPTPVPVESATPAPPPPTPEPKPTFAPAVGRGAAAVKAAQSAFQQGDYARAISQAQTALKEDPGNSSAQKLLDNALNGQKAEARFRAAEAALAKGDYGQAQSEADAGRALAPWDTQANQITGRIRDAQQRAESQAQAARQQQLATQVNAFLTQADNALAGQKYDVAINLYDEALKLDPTNQRATLGKTSAVAARAVAQAAAAGAAAGATKPAGKAFAVGKTVAQGAEKTGGSVPAGFEESAGVTAKSGTAAADLPGRLTFDVEPDAVKPGEKYTVKVQLQNEGDAPIQIRDMIVTTTVNGRRAQGPVQPLTKDVAPRQRAMLIALPDFWKEDTSSWSMEVLVRTVRGESYKNRVDWK
jgi:serine/threonine-protein kinase